jgi:CheY-like chemotaxis protein
MQEKILHKNKTILVVEDEDILLELMEDILKTQGYKLFTAKDGIEGIEIYTNHKNEIDLILSDVNLPNLDGLEMFKKIKELNSDVKIIMASGYVEPSLRAEIIKEGVKHFINKPYVANEVLEKIHEVLDNY